MRSIPAELKNRIEKAQMTLYENANPHMKIFVYNSRWNELFTVYTIHNDTGLERLDTTAKRETAEAEPNMVYTVYIKDGTAHVISKPLPYNEMIPWDYEFEVGAADDVAIEFNGYWQRDQVSKRFNFIAEEYPWVFKQSGGTLTAQHWTGGTLQLATGVGRICALRGWIPAQAGHTQDQGLIVAYLKSGTAYYRNYALQENETYIWESEKEIEELPGGLTDIALFRTNDFRIGVLGRDSLGQVHMTVTVRNYAGMSLYPEIINTSTSIQDMSIELTPLTFADMYAPDEIMTAETSYTYPIGLCPLNYSIEITATRTGTDSLTISFNYPLIHGEGQESGFTIQGNREVATMLIDGNQIHLTLTAESDPFSNIVNHEISYNGISFDCPIVAEVTDACRIPMHEFTVIMPGDPPEVEETITATTELSEMVVTLTEIQFIETEDLEQGIVSAETDIAEMTIKMYDLNENPI